MDTNDINNTQEARSSAAHGSAHCGEGLGRDCCNQPIIPKAKKLSMHTNRHRNCDGTRWGWNEGCTLNICWSNDRYFNEKRAGELVARWNAQNGRDQRPGAPKL